MAGRSAHLKLFLRAGSTMRTEMQFLLFYIFIRATSSDSHTKPAKDSGLVEPR